MDMAAAVTSGLRQWAHRHAIVVGALQFLEDRPKRVGHELLCGKCPSSAMHRWMNTMQVEAVPHTCLNRGTFGNPEHVVQPIRIKKLDVFNIREKGEVVSGSTHHSSTEMTLHKILAGVKRGILSCILSLSDIFPRKCFITCIPNIMVYIFVLARRKSSLTILGPVYKTIDDAYALPK